MKLRYHSLVFGCMIGLLVASSARSWAAFVKNPDANTLWEEDGRNISVGPKPDQWRNDLLEIKAAEGGGFLLRGGEQKYQTGHYLHLNRDYRYLVMDITKVDRSPGYCELVFLFLGMKAPTVGMISNIETGRFIFPVFREGVIPPDTVFLNIYLRNAAVTFKTFKMVREPANNLQILPVRADATVVKPGDTVTFRVTLEKPAEDVTLTFFDSSEMPRLRINGQSRLQLKPEDPARKIWSATLRINGLTYDGGRKVANLKPGKLMARTTILGGSIDTPLWTWNTIPFDFKEIKK